MSWQCKLIDRNERKGEIGEIWFAHESLSEFRDYLSPEYFRDWYDKRLPLIVVTPAGTWCIDAKQCVNGQHLEQGWTVTGEAPNVTASPSINFPGRYHGWLQNGVLSDDCEGRTYSTLARR